MGSMAWDEVAHVGEFLGHGPDKTDFVAVILLCVILGSFNDLMKNGSARFKSEFAKGIVRCSESSHHCNDFSLKLLALPSDSSVESIHAPVDHRDVPHSDDLLHLGSVLGR